MTKQDFELIARVLREVGRHDATDPTYAEGWHAALASVRVRLMRELKADNPRFNAQRFEAACTGVDSFDSGGRAVRYSAA